MWSKDCKTQNPCLTAINEMIEMHRWLASKLQQEEIWIDWIFWDSCAILLGVVSFWIPCVCWFLINTPWPNITQHPLGILVVSCQSTGSVCRLIAKVLQKRVGGSSFNEQPGVLPSKMVLLIVYSWLVCPRVLPMFNKRLKGLLNSFWSCCQLFINISEPLWWLSLLWLCLENP